MAPGPPKRPRTTSQESEANNTQQLLTQILETVQSNKSELSEVKTSLKNFEAKYNELSDRCEYLENENEYLKEKYDTLSINIDRINQQALSSNLEIAGVLETSAEDIKEIAAKIITNLGFETPNVVKSAYRRNTKSTSSGLPKPIIVSIVDKGIRDKILVASRKIKNLNSTIITNPSTSTEDNNESTSSNATVINTPARPIYINEHLTDFNKYLLARAKQLYRNNKLYSVYVRNGFVIARTEDNNSPEIRILKSSQLDEFDSRH